jgi:hypothetical protein
MQSAYFNESYSRFFLEKTINYPKIGEWTKYLYKQNKTSIPTRPPRSSNIVHDFREIRSYFDTSWTIRTPMKIKPIKKYFSKE